MLQKIKRRGPGRVCAALDHQEPRRVRMQQRRQHGLVDQRGAAGRPDREAILPGIDALWSERQLGGVEVVAGDVGVADLLRRPHTSKVLLLQARRLAPGTNAEQTKRLAGNNGKGERGSKNLPAAFTMAAVDLDHPFTHTICLSVWT